MAQINRSDGIFIQKKKMKQESKLPVRMTYGLAVGGEYSGAAAFDGRDLPVDPCHLGILHPHVRPHDDVHRRPLLSQNQRLIRQVNPGRRMIW